LGDFQCGGIADRFPILIWQEYLKDEEDQQTTLGDSQKKVNWSSVLSKYSVSLPGPSWALK
jgi:hypothetical protein